MANLKKICTLFLLFFAFSCTDSSTSISDETLSPSTLSSATNVSAAITGSLTPYSANPQYWAYKGQPVVLLGGSKDDNLFQIPDLRNQLDLIASAGGNYVRNTMSDRDPGSVKAFARSANGQYDLNTFNEEYFQRFENLLQLAAQRDIIVQIELWDQFDHNSNRWNSDPWNPDQNVNYTTTNTRLRGNGNYGSVSYNNQLKHDLFLTTPKVNNDEIVLGFQKKFIDKVLSVSLQYNNVLYTITNELFSQHPIEWGFFWIDYIKERAAQAGKTIQATEMLQDIDMSNPQVRTAFENPRNFSFVELSQNSVKRNQKHWDDLQVIRSAIAEDVRPVNHTKIYGSDDLGWTGGNRQGVERFWRNIIGGAASSRFHRPTGGIGLSSIAQTQIRSTRMLLSEFNIFDAQPDINSSKLSSRSSDEAYLSYISGQQYAIYFPKQGQVELDMSDTNGSFQLKWLNINGNSWSSSTTFNGGGKAILKTPGNGSWVALITSVK